MPLRVAAALFRGNAKAYEGYAKRTAERALAATRKRHAHRIAARAADNTGTDIQNEPRSDIQNGLADRR